MTEEVIRIAARGDGVTASGKHFGLAAPGDVIENGQIVRRGASYQQPPCKHFPQCGGCQLQHLSDEAFGAYCRDRVEDVLAFHEVEGEVLAPHVSPPRSRRRASLKALQAGGRVLLGFNEERSHKVVDLVECHVLHPELFAILRPLRKLLATMLGKGGVAQVQMTLADQGIDLMLTGVEADGLDAIEAMTDFATSQKLARLTLDEGYGAEPRWAPEPVTITLSGVPVELPPGSFLQATADSEAALVRAVQEALGKDGGPILDLFAGLGTFALGFSERDVTAAEAGRDAILALGAAAKRAGRAISVAHRDLYRNPYRSDELGGFEAVVLDPPRSGAAAQCEQLAASGIARIAYVSCNPSTFAKDAKVLVDGGYRLDWVRPVGQFRWSTHVELAARFSR